MFGVLNFSQLWKILDTIQQVFNHQACPLLAELSSLGNEIMIHTTRSMAISSQMCHYEGLGKKWKTPIWSPFPELSQFLNLFQVQIMSRYPS